MSGAHAVVGARALRVTLVTDLPPGSTVKIAGSLPELGGWDVEKAPVLVWDASSSRFAATVAVPGTAPADVEYKLVARRPRAPGAQHDTEWTWQPGPNRHVALAAAGGAAAAEKWFPSRDGTAVIADDGYLEPNRGHLADRYARFSAALATIEALPGGLDAFTRGWTYFGLNRVPPRADGSGGGVQYREWAPGARGAALVGDFNGWRTDAHRCTVDAFGVWSVFVPDGPGGAPAIPHNSHVKVALTLAGGSGAPAYRIPAWARYATYDAAANEYVARFWDPPAAERHAWAHARTRTHVAADYGAVPGIDRLPSHAAWTGRAEPAPAASAGTGAAVAAPAAARAAAPARAIPDPAAAGLRVYEAHVGMASTQPRVATYREFATDVLPRVVAAGFNCVQLMAVMEHAYYGSFGYHVTSFLAASSRFGTPEDLKFLVDAAHAAGLLVIMDLVHSHASKNVADGLNMFDGTDFQYFHGGPAGEHALWDSRLFDYSKLEVQRLLLSSARLFVEEFRFDGYRFDGVTSMMYTHHGLSVGFSGDYAEYFGGAADTAAVVYLMLANHVLHTLEPPALSVAEDVSGMPTLCRPVWEGGVGFDYRLAMATPDMWIKLLKESRDEDWSMAAIVHTLTNRRWQEKTVAYAESHDQALVGDKTLAFWLMDKEMYWHMRVDETPMHPAVARGVALHKLIRLLTAALGGEAWLTFMGNEFGHPEWVDFPRIGNNWSYHYCRRQWNLVDDPALLYSRLAAFEAAMNGLEQRFQWLESRDSYVSLKHEGDKMIAFERGTASGPLVFIFNLHPTESYVGYRIGVPAGGDWVVALDSDAPEFGGFDRVRRDTVVFPASEGQWHGRPFSVLVYSCSRTALVLKHKGAK